MPSRTRLPAVPVGRTPSAMRSCGLAGAAEAGALASGAMKVTLPDDTLEGAARRRHRRRPGPRDRARPGQGGARGAGWTATSRIWRRRCPDGERVEIVTDRSPDALDLIRHDAAHVMATAVMELYPGTKISIGPPIENGFYYDFEFPEGVKVSDEDLAAHRGAHARARRRRRAVRAHRRARRRGASSASRPRARTTRSS